MQNGTLLGGGRYVHASMPKVFGWGTEKCVEETRTATAGRMQMECGERRAPLPCKCVALDREQSVPNV